MEHVGYIHSWPLFDCSEFFRSAFPMVQNLNTLDVKSLLMFTCLGGLMCRTKLVNKYMSIKPIFEQASIVGQCK